MTDTRFWLYAVALPGAVALAVLAAVVIPAGDQLGWPRLIAGFGAYAAVHIGGSTLAGIRIRRGLERP
ncbi:hypothetical protein [Streptomyces sp. NBC_01373]|uniref:hypothetical protein n=1 Tax=Streptomyces sp. NBC_01373 TaxID=2903843 RepID=UPI002259C3DC|nr:hypothetical protein [Streptomyces sp. NBC_01373]MCX4707083.1 hypothetical protein [Streptomyces sp. NBC_01373]